MTFSMTPTQYASVVAKLKMASPAEVKSFTCDGSSGLIDTDLVDLNYRYNGVDTLDVQVAARHGIARFASDKTVQSHIADMLGAAE